MTLQFEETTPGVHMAMWESPNTGNARTVVIIESLGQFTLYIDGDVAARDLDSFESAAARAQSMLTSGGSRRMIQVAGALAVFIAVGGAAVGLTQLLSSTSGIATAVTAETQSIVKDVTNKPKQVAKTQFTTFKPVKPRKRPVVVSKVEPTSTTAAVPATNPVTPVVVNSTIPAPTAQAEAKIETSSSPATAPKGAKAEVEPAGPRIFSATRPVFAGGPEKQPEAQVVTNPVVTAAPIKTEERTLAAVEAPKPAAPQEVAIEQGPATEVGSLDQPRAPIDPETLPLPNRNPSAQFAAVDTDKSEAQFIPVPAAPAPQVAPSPYQTGTTTARQGRSADSAYESLMERAAAKRRAKLEKRRRALRTKKYTKKKVVKTKRYTKKKRRTVRRKSRRVMRCLSNGCRWVARNGYYDRQYRRGHY